MPTDPKDNKGGDLAEIKDLQGRATRGTVRTRKNTVESGHVKDPGRVQADKTRLVHSSREQFQAKKIGHLKAKVDAWAAQEKADIESGTKRVPLTSREKAMSDKDLAAIKGKRSTLQGKQVMLDNADRKAGTIVKDWGRVKAQTFRESMPLDPGEKEKGFKVEGRNELSPDSVRNKSLRARANAQLAREINPAWNKAHRTAIAEGRIGDPAPMPSDLHATPGSQTDFRSTGLRDTLDLGRRTQAHHLQSREFPKTKTGLLEFGGQSKDLGRATLNTIRREADIAGSGSLAKLAKSRQAAGRSVAGPDPAPVGKKPRWNAKGSRGGKGGGGAAPQAIETDRDATNRMNKTWNKVKAIVPGELPDLD